MHGDLLTFVAEDDVWMAPVSGGRAWRVSALQLPAKNPRFSPDGKRLVWTVIQGTSPEVVTADVDGGDYRQLTYFGHASTKLKGFTAAGDAVVTSGFRQAESRHTHAYRVPLQGGWSEELPFGPVECVAFGPEVGDERPVVLSSVLSREPAWWKRYRGGTAGKLWIDADGNGEFDRLLPELDGNLTDPLWVKGRIAFLSDHEGYGNLYSALPNGKDVRRHTDHQDYYVRHATTDGTRVAFESAGELWILENLESEPRKVEIRLGSASANRRPVPLNVSKHLGEVVPDATGKSSAVEAHGTIHWLSHKDGPSRVVEGTAGVRGRLPRPVAGGRIAYVADHGGEEALFLRDIASTSGSGPDRTAVAAASNAAPQKGESSATPSTGFREPSEDDAVLPRPIPAATGTVPVRPDKTGGGVASSPLESMASANGASAGEALEGKAADRSITAADTAAAPDTAERVLSPSGNESFPIPSGGRASALEASPDGASVALATAFGEVYVLDTLTRSLRLVSSIGDGTITDLCWSADSAWLAWSEPVTAFGSRSRLRMAQVADQQAAIIDVTDGRFNDDSPAFTPDGRFLAFLSNRSFDPVYDGHAFDLSFPTPIKPYLVALAADTPSPFGPTAFVPDGDSVSERNDSTVGRADGETKIQQPVSVDREGLALRIITVPVTQGNYSKLSAVEGALLWLDTPLSGVLGDGRAAQEDKDTPASLTRFDMDRRKTTKLVEAASTYRVSADGKKLVVVHEKKVTVVPADAKADEEKGTSLTVDLTRIRVLLDPVQSWHQAFNEAWRLQRDFFWAADMAGQDWEEVRARYLPLVDRLGSHDDLVDVLWEVNGELGTSHAYVRPFAVAEKDSRAQGRLGADLEQTESGWEVTRVLAGESSDPLATSPLTRPGVNVRKGDVLLAVDGVTLAERTTPAMLLVGAAGRAVELTVRNGDSHGAAAGVERRVAVVPMKDEERLRYQEWVAGNRRTVREASDGRYGYLHVPDMMAHGWAQLHRDLDSEAALDGLIVDVRRNRGGHTSQLVAELIGRKVTGWSMPRGERPETYPHHAPRGPVIIITDEFAGSDGDIITQVSKLRGIGPVIGTRTWGGVVGIDNRYALADGTGVTQPRYATWFTGGVGWSVENYGVDPDIEVLFPPHAYAAGGDPQLEYGIGALKEMIQELPTDLPPAREGYRTLKPAPLPPRKK